MLPILLTLGLLAVLAALSLAPAGSEPVRSSPLWLQKTMHVALYGVLAALTAWSLSSIDLDRTVLLGLAWLLAAGFGALMELLQRGRPRRSGNWADVGRNAAGAAIGVAVMAVFS